MGDLKGYNIHFKVVRNKDIDFYDYMQSPSIYEEIFEYDDAIECLEEYKELSRDFNNIIEDDKVYGVHARFLSITIFILLPKWEGFDSECRTEFYKGSEYVGETLSEEIKALERRYQCPLSYMIYLTPHVVELGIGNRAFQYNVKRYYKDFLF